MIDLTRINAQQDRRNSEFAAWLKALNAKFEELGHHPNIVPYFTEPNVDFEITPVVALVSYAKAGPGTFYLSYYHAQAWKDLKASVDTILYRVKVT